MPNDAKTVNVVLPAGMTIEAFTKSMESFTKQKVWGKKHDKAVRNTMEALKTAHKGEYDTLLTAACKKEGIPISLKDFTMPVTK